MGITGCLLELWVTLFFVRNSVVLAICLLFLFFASLPYMSICTSTLSCQKVCRNENILPLYDSLINCLPDCLPDFFLIATGRDSFPYHYFRFFPKSRSSFSFEAEPFSMPYAVNTPMSSRPRYSRKSPLYENIAPSYISGSPELNIIATFFRFRGFLG